MQCPCQREPVSCQVSSEQFDIQIFFVTIHTIRSDGDEYTNLHLSISMLSALSIHIRLPHPSISLPSQTYRAYKNLVTRLKNLDKPINTVEEFDAYLPSASLPLASIYSLSYSCYYDSDGEEYTNLSLSLSLSLSASCSFDSYTPHFPSPSPCLPYLTIPLLSSSLQTLWAKPKTAPFEPLLLRFCCMALLPRHSCNKVTHRWMLSMLWLRSGVCPSPNTFSVPSGNEYAVADNDEDEDNDEYTNLCLSSPLPVAFYSSYSSFNAFTTIP